MVQDNEIKLAIVHLKYQDDRGLEYIIQTSDNKSVINKILTETGVSDYCLTSIQQFVSYIMARTS